MHSKKTEGHSILEKAYAASFAGYALIFAFMSQIGDLTASVMTVILLAFQLSYLIVLRKRDRMSIGGAVMQGTVSSLAAVAAVILEMYIKFFVCGMSTTNVVTGEMKLVSGLDIFRVSGTDKLMNIFLVSLFAVCVVFAAVFSHFTHRTASKR